MRIYRIRQNGMWGQDKMAKILEDVSSQLVSVQKQINKKEESSLARKLLGVQLLVFATIIIITVIMLIDTLSSTLQF